MTNILQVADSCKEISNKRSGLTEKPQDRFKFCGDLFQDQVKGKSEDGTSLKISVYESLDGRTDFNTVYYSLSDLVKKFSKPSRCSKKQFASGLYLLGSGKDGGTCRGSEIYERSGISFDLDKPNLSIQEATERLNSLGWIYILHTTKSYTPNKPRYRLIVLFDKPVKTEKEYVSLYQYTIEQIGIDKKTEMIRVI